MHLLVLPGLDRQVLGSVPVVRIECNNTDSGQHVQYHAMQDDPGAPIESCVTLCAGMGLLDIHVNNHSSGNSSLDQDANVWIECQMSTPEIVYYTEDLIALTPEACGDWCHTLELGSYFFPPPETEECLCPESEDVGREDFTDHRDDEREDCHVYTSRGGIILLAFLAGCGIMGFVLGYYRYVQSQKRVQIFSQYLESHKPAPKSSAAMTNVKRKTSLRRLAVDPALAKSIETMKPVFASEANLPLDIQQQVDVLAQESLSDLKLKLHLIQLAQEFYQDKTTGDNKDEYSTLTRDQIEDEYAREKQAWQEQLNQEAQCRKDRLRDRLKRQHARDLAQLSSEEERVALLEELSSPTLDEIQKDIQVQEQQLLLSCLKDNTQEDFSSHSAQVEKELDQAQARQHQDLVQRRKALQQLKHAKAYQHAKVEAYHKASNDDNHGDGNTDNPKSMLVQAKRHQIVPLEDNEENEESKARTALIKQHQVEALKLEQLLEQEQRIRDERLKARLTKKAQLHPTGQSGASPEALEQERADELSTLQRASVEALLNTTSTTTSDNTQYLAFQEKVRSSSMMMMMMMGRVGNAAAPDGATLEAAVISAATIQNSKLAQDHQAKVHELNLEHEQDRLILEQHLEHDRKAKTSNLATRLRERKEAKIAATAAADQQEVLANLKLEEEREMSRLNAELDQVAQAQLAKFHKHRDKEMFSVQATLRLAASARVKAAKRQALKQQVHLETLQEEHHAHIGQLEAELEKEQTQRQSTLQARLRKRKAKKETTVQEEPEEVDELEENPEVWAQAKRQEIDQVRAEQKRQEEASRKLLEDATIEALASKAAYSDFKANLVGKPPAAAAAGAGVKEQPTKVEEKPPPVVVQPPPTFDETLTNLVQFDPDQVQISMDQVYVVERFVKMMRKHLKKKR